LARERLALGAAAEQFPSPVGGEVDLLGGDEASNAATKPIGGQHYLDIMSTNEVRLPILVTVPESD
jgi:hypothetical protein